MQLQLIYHFLESVLVSYSLWVRLLGLGLVAGELRSRVTQLSG